MPQKTLLLFLLMLLSFEVSFSQKIAPKKDSTEVYKNIQTYSKKHKFTNFLHKLVFKPINPKQKRTKKVVQQNYQAFEGKIIRKINIETLDPFGYSEIDSTKKPRNWVKKTGIPFT